MKLLSILLFTLPLITIGQTRNFRGTFDELQAEAKRIDRPYLVEFYASWCGYCKKFDREVMTDSAFFNVVNANMLFQKINGEIDTQTASEFNVKGYPTFILFSPDGTVLKKIGGYQTTDQFLRIFEQLELTKKNNQYNFSNYRAAKAVSIGQQKEKLELSEIGKVIYSKYMSEFSLLDCEELIIEYPEHEDYIKYYYEYVNNGFDIEVTEQAYENKILNSSEVNYLFIKYLLDKDDSDKGDLAFVNLLLAQDPNNIDLLDTKAYIYLITNHEKDAKSQISANKKALKKSKKTYEPTQELEKLIK